MDLDELKPGDLVRVAMFAYYLPMLDHELNEVGCRIAVVRDKAEGAPDAELAVTLDSRPLRHIIKHRTTQARWSTAFLLMQAGLLVLAGVAHAPLLQGVAGLALVTCGVQLIKTHWVLQTQRSLVRKVERKEKELGWVE